MHHVFALSFGERGRGEGPLGFSHDKEAYHHATDTTA